MTEQEAAVDAVTESQEQGNGENESTFDTVTESQEQGNGENGSTLDTVAKSQEQDNGENGSTVDEVSELENMIIHQVEYYFGDSNLPRDKFLREQVKLEDGWVPVEILTKFNRLAKLTTDLEVISSAINKSTSGLLELSEDNKKVRRNPEKPLPEMNEENRQELQARTIYAKGFPKNSAIDDILKFFKDHGDIVNVIMRKYLDKPTKKRIFKGSVFATFKTKEEAEKFMNETGIKYGETELIRRWQQEYLKDKQEEYANRKEKREKKIKTTEEKKEKEDLKLPTGTVLHFSQGHDTMTRENIKDALTPLDAEIAYIDFKVGDTEGWVRLSKQDMAKEVFERITDGKIKIGDSEVVFKLLEGDEEKEYLDKTVQNMLKRRKDQKTNRNKGKNFRGKPFSLKRKHGQNEDEPKNKRKAEAKANNDS